MGGKMGACPEDYHLFKTAQWLGVAPWELMEQSIWWRDRAIMFMNAETQAAKIIDAHRR
jgi:hypothetical protein